MTKQEIFNIVSNHLITQNQRSWNGDNGVTGCKYRSNGLKCAAGCLIPDDEYSLEMEGNVVTSLKWFRIKFSRENLEFIRDLQVIHDKFEPGSWKTYLRQLALMHNLIYKF